MSTDPITPRPIPLCCRFGWHRWGQWAPHTTTLVANGEHGPKITLQRRQCSGCGLTQMKRMYDPYGI